MPDKLFNSVKFHDGHTYREYFEPLADTIPPEYVAHCERCRMEDVEPMSLEKWQQAQTAGENKDDKASEISR